MFVNCFGDEVDITFSGTAHGVPTSTQCTSPRTTRSSNSMMKKRSMVGRVWGMGGEVGVERRGRGWEER